MRAAIAVQPARNHRAGSITTAGGGEAALFTPLHFPREECGSRQADRDRNKRGTQLEQEADRQDGCPEEELPFHFHIITTNISASMAERTTAGTVSGFVHSTLRMLVCCNARISFICCRAIASWNGLAARSAARRVSSSARL